MPYLVVENLHKSFTTPGGREVLALRDVSFALRRGEILCVVGHNGSGKTTLLNCLRGSFPCDQGRVMVGGEPMTARKPNVVSVFQEVGFGVVGSMTPLENLSLVFSHDPGFMTGIPKHRFRKRIEKFLDETGLRERFGGFDETPVSELSGGQRQQVAIVMALMRRPDILLLDEFVANLDTGVKAVLLPWMRDWILTHDITTLMVTHDMDLAHSWGHWVLELSDGAMVSLEQTAANRITSHG